MRVHFDKVQTTTAEEWWARGFLVFGRWQGGRLVRYNSILFLLGGNLVLSFSAYHQWEGCRKVHFEDTGGVEGFMGAAGVYEALLTLLHWPLALPFASWAFQSLLRTLRVSKPSRHPQAKPVSFQKNCSKKATRDPHKYMKNSRMLVSCHISASPLAPKTVQKQCRGGGGGGGEGRSLQSAREWACGSVSLPSCDVRLPSCRSLFNRGVSRALEYGNKMWASTLP